MIRTTLVRITDSQYRPIRNGHQIFTSLEGENPGQSIKDRIVLGELSELLKSGQLAPGDHMAEITAGSTGLSLAYYCKAWNLKCTLFAPLNLKPSLVNQLKNLGADLHLLDPSGAYEKYDAYIEQHGIRKLDQFGNLQLRRHYLSLAADIVSTCQPSLIIGSVGTGHSLLGLSQSFPKPLRVISAEPLPPATVLGIRNLSSESYGEKDPCPPQGLERVELQDRDFFAQNQILTDHGRIEISDSFRVVLGALEKVLHSEAPTCSFAIGSNNRRLDPLATL